MNLLDAKHLAQAILWTVVSVSSKHILTLQIPFVILTVGSGNYPVGIVPLYLCVLFRNGPTKPIIPDSQLEKDSINLIPAEKQVISRIVCIRGFPNSQ